MTEKGCLFALVVQAALVGGGCLASRLLPRLQPGLMWAWVGLVLAVALWVNRRYFHCPRCGQSVFVTPAGLRMPLAGEFCRRCDWPFDKPYPPRPPAVTPP